MAILRIEGVVYGVEDLAAGTRFFSDVGLETVRTDRGMSVFRTPVNQRVELRALADPALPPPVYAGSGVREIVWGVDSDAALEAIRRDLSTDRPVSVDADGTVHSQDLTGYGIAFRRAEIAPWDESPRSVNTPGHIGRLSENATAHGRARPVRLMHIAMDIPAADHEAANNFYIQRLRFKVIDRSVPVGDFMQCEGSIEHHNLLLVHRSNRASTNHMALEVRDHDEVIEGGNFMTEQGWKEARRLGRHTLGSNVFRFFHSPCGGRIELAHDMDRMDKSFKTRVWEKAPPHHLWILKFPGDEARSQSHHD